MDEPQKSERQISHARRHPKVSPQARPPEKRSPEFMRWIEAKLRTIQYCKTSILNAIFTTALDDEVVMIHPSRE
jgi:hypothetical protein